MEFITYLGTTFGPVAALVGLGALGLWAVYTKAVKPEREAARAREDRREDRLMGIIDKNADSHRVLASAIDNLNLSLSQALENINTQVLENRKVAQDGVRDVREDIRELRQLER